MGKVSCEACNKKCKGQAIKLPSSDKYFHVKCFKCSACSRQLSSCEYFYRDGNYYCTDDYKRLFTVRCCACGSSVEGEVITALQKVFHPGCFQCVKCGKQLTAGEKVNFNGAEFVCVSCSSDSATASDGQNQQQQLDGAANNVSRSPGRSPVRPSQIPVQTQQLLHSPDSNYPPSNGVSPLSPVSMTSGYKSDASYDQTPEVEKIHARTNGQLSSSMSCPNGDSRGFLSPYTHFMKYRSASPISNASSRKSKEWAGSGGLGGENQHFGKFLQIAYMDLKDGYKRGPSINAAVTDNHPQHFHRPADFSYRKIRTDIVNNTKTSKKAMSFFGGAKPAVRSEPYKPSKTQEPIQLSKLPDAQRSDESHVMPIERDDWPSPPAPAAAYPELLRERFHRSAQRGGELSSINGDNKENINELPNGHTADPKMEREIQELSKLPDSGAAKVILEQLKKKKLEPTLLDPRSASRTPNAAKEPAYKTRYESPIFASPSRDLDLRLQLPPLDDSFAETKYRTPSPANFLAPRPGYGLRSSGVESRSGFISDSVDGYYYKRPGSSAAVLERTSCYSSQSDLDEYDPTTGLRRNTRLRSTALSDGRRTPYSLKHRRSVPNAFTAVDEPLRIFPYEELRLSKTNRPPGVDNGFLEQHLSKEEFEDLFHMTQEEFYRLAEWKRNDIKRRVELF